MKVYLVAKDCDQSYLIEIVHHNFDVYIFIPASQILKTKCAMFKI